MATATKATLRDRFRRARDAIGEPRAAAWSDAIRDRVIRMPLVRDAQSFFVYASAGSEVRTYQLIQDLLVMNKIVCLPRVTDAAAGQMEAVPIKSLKDLAPAPFGTLAPLDGQALGAAPELALVPGLAFAPATGVRLGMGRGFYDRYLAAQPTTRAIGLAFECQLTENLPIETHDQPVHAVVSESHLHARAEKNV